MPQHAIPFEAMILVVKLMEVQVDGFGKDSVPLFERERTLSIPNRGRQYKVLFGLRKIIR